MKNCSFLFAVGLVLACSPSGLWATTYYVSTSGDGSDPTSGDWAKAYDHPQAAINAAVAAGVSAEAPADILVDDGTYGLYQSAGESIANRVVDIATSHIRLKARNSRKAILDGQAIDKHDNVYRTLTIASGLSGVSLSGFVVKRGTSVMSTAVTDASCINAQSGLLSDMDIQGLWVSGNPMAYLAGSVVVSNFTFSVPSRMQYNSNRGTPCCIYLDGNAELHNGAISNITPYTSYMDSNGRFQAVYMTSANNLMRNCLVMGNTAGKDGTTHACQNVKGGGVYASAGTIESCTIVGNTAWGKGGGIYIDGPVTLRNAIVWGNSALGTNAEGTDIYVANGQTPTIECCDASTGLTAGENGNLCSDPNFGPDGLTPAADSALAGSGLAEGQDWMAEAKDLAGNARLWTDGTVTPGAYETQGRETKFFVGFSVAGGDGALRVANGRVPYDAAFSASLSQEIPGATFTWDFGDGTVLENVTDRAPTHRYGTSGDYAVSLVVRAPGHDDIRADDYTIIAVGDTCYVKEGAVGIPPYDSWEKATSSIMAAVKLAPDTIVVTNGTYVTAEAEGVSISVPLTLRSVEGPEVTFLDTGITQQQIPMQTLSTFRRNLTIKSAGVTVDGFTFRRAGGRVVSASGGVVRNCRLGDYWGAWRDVSFRFGGDARVEDCTFDFNGRSLQDQNAGGGEGGYLGGYAAGVMLEGSAVMDRCRVYNYAWIRPNEAMSIDRLKDTGAAGVLLTGSSALRNCCVTGCVFNLSSAHLVGGGVHIQSGSPSVENCTIVGNSVRTNGLEIAGMTAPGAWGGGLYTRSSTARVNNNVIYGNLVNDHDGDYDAADGVVPVSFSNNLVRLEAELPASAANCVSGKDPLIVPNSSCRITVSSPCHNAGASLDWCARRGMATDIDGQERRQGRPDIGCFEVQHVPGLILRYR